MKIFFVSLLFLLVTLNSFCQNCRVNISVSESVVGKSFIENQSIKAVTYLFPEKIINITPENSSNHLMVEICDKYELNTMYPKIGRSIMLDWENKNPMWDKKLDYLMESCTLVNDRMIIYGFRNQFELYDSNTSKLLLKSKEKMIGTLSDYNMIFARYENEMNSSGTRYIQAINSENGHEIWKRKLSYKMNNCEQLKMVNDTTVAFLSNGWDFCNIYNGKGGSFVLETSKNDYTSTAISAIGLAAGLIGGMLILPMGGASEMSGINSNLAFDSTGYYCAGRSQLKALDLKGNLYWTTELDKHKTSASTLFIKDSLLVLLNKGYANYGNSKSLCGLANISVYSKNNGQLLSSYDFQEKKVISDFQIDDKNLSLLVDNHLFDFQISTLTKFLEIIIPVEKKESVTSFVNPYNFGRVQNNILMRLSDKSDENLFASTNKGRIIEISKGGRVENTYFIKESCIYSTTIGKYRLFVQENEGFLFDDEAKCVASFEAYDKNLLIGNHLFTYNENRLIQIDLSQFYKKQLTPNTNP